MSTLTLAVLVVVASVILGSSNDNTAEAKMAKGLSKEKSRCTGWSNSGQNTRGKYNRKKCRKPWDRKSMRDFDYDDDDDSEYGNGDQGESNQYYGI